MSGNYYDYETKILEEAGLVLLNELGIEAKSNNIKNINDPDYILESGKYIDFQFSNNFKKYGDIRIDTISAYETNSKNRIQLQKEIRKSAKQSTYSSLFHFLEQFMQIKKQGKFFEANEIFAILYFFYNFKFRTGKPLHPPDHILLLSTISIRNFIKDNWKNLIAAGALKLNEKSVLGDKHGSAFICLPFKKISEDFCTSSPRRFNFFNSSIPFHIDKKLRYLIA